MDEIEICGGLVTLRSVNVLKQISVEDFQSSVIAASGQRTPILPDGVVFYAAKDATRLYVRCRPPGSATLNWKTSKKNTEAFQSTVRMPWVYFFHVFSGHAFDDLYVFCSAERISETGEMLCRLPIRNQHSDCHICLGNDLKFGLEGRISGKLARVEEHFWNSMFNNDLESSFIASCPVWMKDGGGDPFEIWERLGRAESFDPCRMDWVKYRKWGDAVDNIVGGAI